MIRLNPNVRRICGEFRAWAGRLDVEELACIPISALKGDNVVERSENLDWYGGPTLLQYLEEAPVAAGVADGPLRLPVQWVVAPPSSEHRGYAGQLAGGTVRVGDEVVVLPGRHHARVSAIDAPSGSVDAAGAPLSVAVSLEDELDVARGAMIARAGEAPRRAARSTRRCAGSARQAAARALRAQAHHHHRARRAGHDPPHARGRAARRAPRRRQPVPQRDRARDAAHLGAVLRPLRDNRTTGSFILIDEATNETVGAGMIDGGR